MSYCRWSSDNWRCDLYCYEDVSGGWTTHVAANKVVGDVPKEADLDPPDFKNYITTHKAAMAYLETAERKNIGLAYDGQTFNDDTLEDFRSRLLMLRAAGYHFPDYVLEEIDEEINSEAA